MKKSKKLVIYGTGETALIAGEYFIHDSPYKVVALTVERHFITKKMINQLPVLPFENITKLHSPKEYDMFVAISYTQLNRLRAKYYHLAKQKKYQLATYVSSHAFVWKTAKIGDNCMILENNVIQHGVTIGNDVVLWSGNHIGHRTNIADHVYISSHCVLSGYCRIGAYSFLGVNSTFNDRITVAPDNIIGSGAVVIGDTEPEKIYVGNPAKPLPKSSFEVFKVKNT